MKPRTVTKDEAAQFWTDRPLLPMKAADILLELVAFICLVALIVIMLAVPVAFQPEEPEPVHQERAL